jgi:DNA-binding response OmpR family regulator
MEAARVLFIGRIHANQSSLASALEKRYTLFVASSGKEGLDLAVSAAAQLVVLDAISMRTPGDRICHTLRKELYQMPIVHIHPGPKEIVASPADTILLPPVTARKLLKCVERLLKVHDEEVISYGHLSVNLSRRMLLVRGQEIQLTPKQALLVETFLRHPGETLDRKTLMEKVWQTDYLGDTRTLDVHVRWIREAIEANPSDPLYLRTVRGVGYRLEIPDYAVPELEDHLALVPTT